LVLRQSVENGLQVRYTAIFQKAANTSHTRIRGPEGLTKALQDQETVPLIYFDFFPLDDDGKNRTLAIILGCVFGAIVLLILLVVCCVARGK